MIIRNLVIGLPVILVCMVLQVAIAFWSVRYFVRQTAGATAASCERAHPAIMPQVRTTAATGRASAEAIRRMGQSFCLNSSAAELTQ